MCIFNCQLWPKEKMDYPEAETETDQLVNEQSDPFN